MTVKVELLELVADLDMKIVTYLEALCTTVTRGEHHYTGVCISLIL